MSTAPLARIDLETSARITGCAHLCAITRVNLKPMVVPIEAMDEFWTLTVLTVGVTMEPLVSIWCQSVPVTFSIKGVPDDLAQSLRARASANRRSLQRELMTILERAVQDERARAVPQGGIPDAGAGAGTGRPIEDILDQLRVLLPRAQKGGTPSVQAIRRMRDRRYG